MISDSNNLETIILEEIRRFLENLDGKRSTHLYQDTPGILFLLSQPIPEEMIVSSHFSTIVKQFQSLLLRSQSYTAPPPPCFAKLREIPANETMESLNDLLSQLKMIIIPYPSLSFMAQLTLGITPDPASRLLLQFLIMAKPVFGICDETGRDMESSITLLQNQQPTENNFLSQRIRSALQSLQRQYVKILEDWGITWIQTDKLYPSIQKIMEMERDDKQNRESPPVPSKRIVITQEDIQERIKRGETQWVVPSNVIITSLAREIAEKHGFILKLSS
jgi:hypothetical protein